MEGNTLIARLKGKSVDVIYTVPPLIALWNQENQA